jgi:alpha-amylase/alpha-mannosidase (GH57 family)
MTKSVALLLGVHAHQPVGNFPEVLQDAHARCYGPFIRTLHRYPDFPFALHFSGWLLDYLLQHYPEDMAMLNEMVQRGQVELVGAGETEPVLAVIPNRDRIGQIVALSDKLEKKFGQRPEGAWLTERVWEATVVPALADAGIRYVTVDDYHFLCTGKMASELNGYYTTEEDGRRLDLFPISEALRYRFPFSPALEAVQYLESLAGEGQEAAVYFDDIEKFGIWPETYEWVYEKGWLEDFIRGVLASPLIRPMKFSDYHAEAHTCGIVYLPTTSYIEMNEWTLPAQAANTYADLVHEAKSRGLFDRDKAFLRGGIWKNFITRYPESNWMHKRMLQLSQRFHALPESKKTGEMLELLYQSQANDAYWHGLFGGLYLPHLRRAIYNAIVALEALLDKVAARPSVMIEDLDLDGRKEVFVHNDEIQAVARQDGSAAICELDAYLLKHNFGDTLARQSEHYYRKMHLDRDAQHSGEGIANPHERVSFKHHITQADLALDDVQRMLFLDSLVNGEAVTPLRSYILRPADSHVSHLTFSCEQGNVLIDKRISVSGKRLRVSYQFNGVMQGQFRTEINLAMPSCDGPAGRFVFNGQIPGGFGQPLQFEKAKKLDLQDEVLGGVLSLHLNTPALIQSQPHFSVSQSEAGFEKIMQAVTLTLTWPLTRQEKELIVDIDVSRLGA